MNDKKKLIISVIVLIVIIGGASVLYNNLSKTVEAPDAMDVASESSDEDKAGDELYRLSTDDETVPYDDIEDSEDEENTADESADTEADSEGEETEASDDRKAEDAEEEEELMEAPRFTVSDVEGNAVSLSDLKGKPVVLNVWASWCGPCKNEMPEFEKMYKQYGEDVEFMMVNLTISDTKEDADALIAEEGYTFPVYYDDEGLVQINYYISSIPSTFFINSEGLIAANAMGSISASSLEKGIKMILE